MRKRFCSRAGPLLVRCPYSPSFPDEGGSAASCECLDLSAAGEQSFTYLMPSLRMLVRLKVEQRVVFVLCLSQDVLSYILDFSQNLQRTSPSKVVAEELVVPLSTVNALVDCQVYATSCQG